MGLYYRHPSSLLHDTGAHPENADRIRAIEATLEQAGWPGLSQREAPSATRAQLERVHTATHVERIESFCESGGGMIDADTIAVPESWEAALRASGAAVDATERLLAGEDSYAFCGLRPPGHHAESDRAMGFCLLNTVAVASAHAIAEGGAERVLILDWDVHHGNGTAEIFDRSSEVVYASIHQSPCYPGTGHPGEVGSGPGEGYTINLPVPPGAGPEDFLSLVQRVVVPVARSHRPGLLVVSAGFDAHAADPLANCELDDDCYAQMAATMRELGKELGVPTLICLEGGYDLDALSRSLLATVRAFGDTLAPPSADSGLAREARDRLAVHWPDALG